MKKKILIALLIVIVTPVLISGCQDSSTSDEKPSTKERSESEKGMFDVVSIVTEDDLTLGGRLYGFGKTGVILSHMFPSDQTSWNDFASELTEKGYIVLTFDFRGYGSSNGIKDPAKIDIDEKAAIEFMKDQGVEEVFLIGASMGGTAALKLGASSAISGVVSISSPRSFRGLSVEDEISSVKGPKLFIASVDDIGAAGDAQWLFDNAIDPKDIEIFKGSEHGSDLLDGKEGEKVKKTINDFLEDNTK